MARVAMGEWRRWKDRQPTSAFRIVGLSACVHPDLCSIEYSGELGRVQNAVPKGTGGRKPAWVSEYGVDFVAEKSELICGTACGACPPPAADGIYDTVCLMPPGHHTGGAR